MQFVLVRLYFTQQLICYCLLTYVKVKVGEHYRGTMLYSVYCSSNLICNCV